MEYAKTIVAFVTAVLVAVQQTFVDLDPDVDNWISAAIAILGVVGVYAVPNRTSDA